MKLIKHLFFALIARITQTSIEEVAGDWWFHKFAHAFKGTKARPIKWLIKYINDATFLHEEQQSQKEQHNDN